MLQIKTEGDIRVGWALPETSSCVDLGVDETAYVFDGYNVTLPLVEDRES